MLLSAFCSLFLISFGLGVFWRSSNPENLLLMCFSNMVKSIYIGWFVFIVSYFSGMGRYLPWLSVLFAGAAIVTLFSRFEAGHLRMPTIRQTGVGRALLAIVVTAAMLLSLYEAIRPLGQVFMTWDALASWNRWAIELAGNQYHPYNAAYPILIPGLWSLIYEAQSSTSMWYFSHAFMSVIPLGIAALVAFIGLRQGMIAFLALFIPLFFAFTGKDALYSGYMDQPSAVLAFGGLLVSAFALTQIEDAKRNEFLMLGIVCVSLAVLTKQHAIFAAFAVCLLIAVLAFRRQISFVRAGVLASLFLVPIIGFLFIYLQQQDALWGNLGVLHGVSDRAAAGQSKILMGARKLGAELPFLIWISLLSGTLLNFLFFKKTQALFALFIAALTIPGFLMYADCCTYSERNGIWILGHLAVSSYVGFSLFAEWLTSRKLLPLWLSVVSAQHADDGPPVSIEMPKIALAIIAVALLMFSVEWPTSRLLSRHLDQQRQILPRVQTMLQRNPGLIKSTDALISPVALARYHPDLMMVFRPCLPMSVKCFVNTTPGKTLYMTASWFENPQTLASIESFVAEGRLKVVEQERGLIIYRLEKPLTDSDK